MTKRLHFTLFSESIKQSGFPHTQLVKNLPAIQETQIRFQGWEGPLEKEMAMTPGFLPGESYGQRQATVHGVARVRHKLETKPPPHKAIYYTHDLPIF